MENSKKVAKNFKKLKKYHYGFISIQNTLEKAKKERKRKLSFGSDANRRVMENSKKEAKKFKKLKKLPLWLHFNSK